MADKKKRSKKEIRSEQVNVMLTPTEAEQLRKAALADGRTLSSYVRRLILR